MDRLVQEREYIGVIVIYKFNIGLQVVTVKTYSPWEILQ